MVESNRIDERRQRHSDQMLTVALKMLQRAEQHASPEDKGKIEAIRTSVEKLPRVQQLITRKIGQGELRKVK